MTKTEAKKMILRALYQTLLNDLEDLGAVYLYESPNGEANSEEDQKRINAAARELLQEFKRRST